MNKLNELCSKIREEFEHLDVVTVDGEYIYVEEYYEMTGEEKNSDDCLNLAYENANDIIAKFPELQIFDCGCHRYKYAISTLKLTSDTQR